MSIDALSLSNIDPHNSSRKKIKRVEPEIQRLTAIRHQNVVGQAHHPRQPQLVVQLEQSLDAADMSEDCSPLREERAVVSFMLPPYLDDVLDQNRGMWLGPPSADPLSAKHGPCRRLETPRDHRLVYSPFCFTIYTFATSPRSGR